MKSRQPFCCLNLLCNFFHIQVDQLNVIKKSKEWLQKKAQEGYQDLSDEEKKKGNNMVANDIKISEKMKNQ